MIPLAPSAARWLFRHLNQAIFSLVLGLAVLLAAPVRLQAVAPEAAPASGEEKPPQVRLLLDLLADPEVQRWLTQERASARAPVDDRAGDRAATAASPSHYLSGWLDRIRAHFATLSGAVPLLPDDIRRAGVILGLEFQDRGLIEILLLIAGFVALGFGAERLVFWLTAGARARFDAAELDSVGKRLRGVLFRLMLGLGAVAAFTIGSVGAFLLFDWPPLLQDVVLAYLAAIVVTRIAIVVGRFLFSPSGITFRHFERCRIVPMETEAARFWTRRLVGFAGWLAFGWVTVGLLDRLGFAAGSERLIAYLLGLGLLALAVESVWRCPPPTPPPPPEAEPAASDRRRAWTRAWALSGCFLVLWLLWVASAMQVFWLAVVALALPAAIRVIRRSVNHILRPAGSAEPEGAPPNLAAISLERGLRAALIIGAALLLAHVWHINLVELTARDTVYTRLLRGALSAVVIILIADFAWHVIAGLIDRKLAEARAGEGANEESARRQARLRTLLPILRNILLVVMVVMVGLMALSAMGVEIGPLIAGAGVVGVAIGFGAQTLVKDIISGMFYLLDDAFRVGEYIQSGSYKGTVESFSLRSVKLRHHRGPLYTVPFGALGAIQNMSRDWVIDKLTINVTYDTDLDKAKKLIKQVGRQLTEDPELSPHILETLKMQGVEQFGDFAIQIRLKMMTKPGEQFVIRRRAYAMIKKAFDEGGIHFAFPTVQVAGGEEKSAAVARQGLELVKPPPAP